MLKPFIIGNHVNEEQRYQAPETLWLVTLEIRDVTAARSDSKILGKPGVRTIVTTIAKSATGSVFTM
jgi:hypothetical protein